MKKILSVLLVVGIFMNLFCANTVNAQTTVEQMLENMTTEQKIAQMLMPAFRQYEGENVTSMNSKMEEILKKYGFGGVILFAENNASTEQTVKLIDSIQKANATVDGRAQLLIAVDQEGARVVRLASGTQGPGNMGLGATGDESNAYDMGEIIGSELSKIGYNVNFAPVVDVNNNPSNPVIGTRSFSDDAEVVSRFASSYMNGISGQNVIAALKHFPGHGDTATDSHTGLPRIEKTYDELKENELIPFQGCINDGAEMIMTAHIQYPKIETGTYTSIKDGSTIELPATLSKKIITDVLRGDLNYDGVVVTDAMNMSAIAQNFSVLDSAKLAINAGVDIILMPIDTATESGINALDQFVVDVANLVDTGDISIENVNKAVTRILTLKENHGLLNQYSLNDLQAKIDTANTFVGSKSNHDKEWEIAKKSITLVKNNGMLPIIENEKTVVVVQYANEVLSAEYAVDRLKSEKIIEEDMDVTVFLMRGKEMSEIKSAIQEAKNVLVFTEQGSVAALAGDTYKKFDEMIEYVHSNENKIAFISCNQPYDVARLQEADALLLAWSPKGMDEKPNFSNGTVKTYGVGMPVGVYMAFGKDTEVTGKLPLNIPTLDDEYKYTDELLYERGYGLKYGTEDIGEEIESGEKTLTLDFTNNTYKFGFLDSVKSGSDAGFLYKFILEPVYTESGIEFSGDVAYFNIVDGKVVVGNEDNSIFKLVIDEENLEITLLPTKTNVAKTTVTANRENVETYEFDICDFDSHNHWRTIKYSNVIINITYGKTASGRGSSSSNKVTTKVEETSGDKNNNTKLVEKFTDVKSGDWFYDNVNYVVENELFNGTSETTFEPNHNLTRGMLVTVLYRLSGATETEKSDFTDVEEGAYYSTPIAWASKNEFVNGIGDNQFNPDADISRQDLATIIYRYVKAQGKGFIGSWMFLLNYDDRDEIVDYAYEPICWLTMNEVLAGRGDNKIDPKGFATRAETAKIIQKVADLLK